MGVVEPRLILVND
ncbi:hypothetical protein LINPERPRIM_LOCUS15399 [Linum perenne]